MTEEGELEVTSRAKRIAQRQAMVELLVGCGWPREKADQRSIGWDQVWGGPRIVLSLDELVDFASGAIVNHNRITTMLRTGDWSGGEVR